MIVLAECGEDKVRKICYEEFKRKGIKYLIFRIQHIGWKVKVFKK